MGNLNFECDICEAKFEVENFTDTKCPKCGQVYFYDEAITIGLTKVQLDLLRENNAELFKQEDL
jgi:Zn finger protein HypA/HybF involved in hydrogenase expression